MVNTCTLLTVLELKRVTYIPGNSDLGMWLSEDCRLRAESGVPGPGGLRYSKLQKDRIRAQIPYLPVAVSLFSSSTISFPISALDSTSPFKDQVSFT